jgi:Beta-propeller repeat
MDHKLILKTGVTSMRKAYGLFLLSLLISTVSSRLLAASAEPRILSMPITFEENRGQAPSRYQFLSRAGGATALFWENGVDFILPDTDGSRIGLKLLGARPDAALQAQGLLVSVSDYFLGNNPKRWIRGIPNDSQLVYEGIYPGINLVFHGRSGRLEHDFRVAAGTDPGKIRFSIDGQNGIELDAAGNLRISAGSGVVVFHKPEAYQETAKGRRAVEAKFVFSPDHSVQFGIGAYDKSCSLIIDPVFSFSTYLTTNNSSITTQITAVTSDSIGNIYVTGYTGAGFPIVNGEQPVINGSEDAFVSKFDPTGDTLLYSTYLGGSSGNYAAAIALDRQGNIIVAGTSGSNDFPHAGAVPALTCEGNNTCYFVASLTADGSSLNYSGLIGGTVGMSANYDWGNQGRIAIDAAGDLYLAGVTDDKNFEITPGTLSNTVPGYPYDSTFVLKVDTTGALVYGTIIPGTATPDPASTTNVFMPSAISVDANGQATIAGTAGPGLPATSGVVQSTFPNSLNTSDPTAGFVLQINDSASAINYATYVPGTDWLLGYAIDSTGGDVYLTGATSETNLPVSASAYQRAIQQNQFSGFVVEMNGNGTSIPAATYLEGSLGATLSQVAIDSNSNVYVAGMTASSDFPMQNPFVAEWVPGGTAYDMVLAGMSPDLGSLIFGSFLSSTDQIYSASSFPAIAVDSQGNFLVAGETYAIDFPTTADSFEPTPPGPSQDGQAPQAFLAKLNMATPAASVCPNSFNVSFGLLIPAETSTVDVNVKNCGNAPLVIASAISSVSSVSVGSTCGSIAPGSTCPLPLTYASSNRVSGSLTLSDNAVISPQVIQFSAGGTGGIGLTTAPNGSIFATVAAGATANYNLAIGGNGLSGTATITCANAPKGAVCMVPSSITVSASGVASLNVAVSTTSRTGAALFRRNAKWLWAIALFGLIALPLPIKRKQQGLRWRGGLTLALLIVVCSCGGSGAQSAQNPNGTPAGKYMLTLAAKVGASSESLPLTLTVQ